MKCDRCGGPITENLLLCPSCGNILHKDDKDEKTSNNSSSPNPFCGGENKKEEKKIEVYELRKVDKKTSDLLWSVEYHLANFIYIAIITAIAVLTIKFPQFIPIPGLKEILTVVAFTMSGNILLGLLLEPLFYKMDIDFWVALIPIVNVLIFIGQGLKGEGELVKRTIFYFALTWGLSYILNIPSLRSFRICAIILSIIALISAIIALVLIIKINIKIAVNYAISFGFNSLIAKILFVFVPYIMILIIIFDKNRQYTY